MPSSFEALYDEHHDFVLHLLLHIGVPAGSVDDALQEVFVIVHRRLADFDGRTSFRSWLWGITRRVAALHFRTERRARRRLEALLPSAGPATPDEQVQLRQAVAFFDAFVQDLPRRHRDVFFLAEMGGWSAPEIAEALGVKLPTVYSRLSSARERFARAVQRWRGEHQERGTA